MEKIIYPRFLIVKDNFYNDPQFVYQTALQAKFYEPKGYTGLRSKTVFHEKGVRNKLENILGIKINRWDTDPKLENGVFYQAMSEGRQKEIPGVHSDQPYNDITVVIYLTPGLPFHCGTSLWMHKRTGLIDPPTSEDAKKFKMKYRELVDLFEDDAKKRSKWVEIDRAGYRFNRMVAILRRLTFSYQSLWRTFGERPHLSNIPYRCKLENFQDEQGLTTDFTV